MQRRILFGATTFALAFSAAAASALFAQTSETSPSQPSQQSVVYTGCLKKASDLKTGEPLNPGATSSTSVPLSGFVLTNASPGTPTTPPATPTAPPGQSSATTTPPTAPPGTAPSGTTSANSGSTLRIVGMQDDQLRQLVNQRVEISGRIESSDTTATAGTASPTSGTPGTASATGKPTTSQPAATNPATGTSGTTAAEGTSSGSSTGPATTSIVPSFRASSIRVLSASCSGGTN